MKLFNRVSDETEAKGSISEFYPDIIFAGSRARFLYSRMKGFAMINSLQLIQNEAIFVVRIL
jgi:hypothetical protein